MQRPQQASNSSDLPAHHLTDINTGTLQDHYKSVRQTSLSIASPLSDCDMCIQSMTDASPTRWHLAHTTWFFETFLLKPNLPDYQPMDESYNYLFNSYYNGIGKQFPRDKRGTQTRPGVEEILAFRKHVDDAMLKLMNHGDAALKFLIELGLNHEQQHQELMLTDIKHAFSLNPSFPAYQVNQLTTPSTSTSAALDWLEIPEGIYQIGNDGTSFCFDNEKPRHKFFINPCRIASRLVNNAEFLEFIADGGYQHPGWWLADGWNWLQQQHLKAPIYWHNIDNSWHEFSLRGLQPLNPQSPVTHINFYEANAFAAWKGKRLPTEFEWEAAHQLHAPENPCGNFVESQQLQPVAPQHDNYQFWGDTWEWTSSDYAAYPGFKPFDGNAGEYNGKFMCNQYVLRGGSCVTPQSHIRSTYRNFFYPHQNWQFTGIRLVEQG